MDFYWHGMRKDIKKLVKGCQVCQMNKHETVLPTRLLQPLPVLQIPWLDIPMDFIEGLSSSNWMTVILTVVDRLTKFGHFFPMSHPYTASTTTNAAVDQQLKYRYKVLSLLKESLKKAQDRIKLYADRKRFERLFATGKWVSSLKKKLVDQISPLPTLPPVDSEWSVQPKPKLILEWRMMKVGNHASTEVLVKWVELPLRIVHGLESQSFIPSFSRHSSLILS
ncbi:uncharacterized protein LOC122296781 [Carya illinoinensis]|uniref:uncharacterized protein LOC122296781 n=1 Tax=Carya illinoinensis TaxID=32201 RepID=UPI001C71B8DB|nr:uncharacterized protein LOC122296781 [Carya illinoinensis]